MTIGIYCISFEGTDKVYIGQSINMEARWVEHARSMRNGTAKSKLLEAYRVYGEPVFSLLVKCSSEELDNIETSLIIEFDAIENGFNTCSGGRSGSGVSNGTSIFTRAQIVEVLELLADDRVLLYSDIATMVDVTYHTIVNISNGSTHIWLLEQYPELFNKQLDMNKLRQAKASITIGNKTSAKNLGIVYPTLVGPNGVEYTVNNAKQFAKLHGLDDSCLVKLLKGYRKSHKGFFLKYPQERPRRLVKPKPLLLSPNNDIVEITTSLVEFSEIHGLNASNLSGLLSGRYKSHRGWSIYLKN